MSAIVPILRASGALGINYARLGRGIKRGFDTFSKANRYARIAYSAAKSMPKIRSKRFKPSAFERKAPTRKANIRDVRRGVRKTKISEAHVSDRLISGTTNTKSEADMYLLQGSAYAGTNKLKPVLLTQNCLNYALGGSITKHVLEKADATAFEKEDCWVDVDEIRWQIDLKNRSPTRDVLAKFVLFRDKQTTKSVNSSNTEEWDWDIEARNLFIDGNDKCKRWGLETEKDINFDSIGDKMNAEWDRAIYPLYLQKIWKVGFNANSVDLARYPASPNPQVGTYDNLDNTALSVDRHITMRSNNNERRVTIIWKPKGGFRFKYYLRPNVENPNPTFDRSEWIVTPMVDIKWMLWTKEKALFPPEEGTTIPLDYKINMRVYYRDVL